MERAPQSVRVGGGHRPAPHVNILGVRVSALTLAETVTRVIRWAQEPQDSGGPRYVCATSVHGLMEAQRDPSFRAILNGAAIIAADGMPLAWLACLNGHRAAERVYGPALMLEVCRASASLGIRHYFYGGVPRVAKELACRLSTRYAGMEVAGWYSPPFRSLTERELSEVASQINHSGAHVVWVGLSTPKQERWIDAIRSRVAAKVMISVGAAFDLHTGRIKQAPPMLQRVGLEWAFRLAQEPRRLWWRYVRNNPSFVVLAIMQLAGLKEFDVLDHEPRSDA